MRVSRRYSRNERSPFRALTQQSVASILLHNMLSRNERSLLRTAACVLQFVFIS